jgi:hypothetical protein
MRTIIKAIAHNRVFISYKCSVTDETYGYNVFAPIDGGYVRNSWNHLQICEKLQAGGNTLVWNPEKPLVELIRKEYKRMRDSERRERQKDRIRWYGF